MTLKRVTLWALPLATATIACNEEDLTPSGNATSATAQELTVEQGALHFATSDDYFRIGVELANMDPDERKAWETSQGFSSLLTYTDEVTDNFEFRLGEAMGRTDIFSVSADSTIDTDIPLMLAAVANKDGYFYIGSTICKVDNQSMASVENGTESDVDAALRTGIIPNGLSGNVLNHKAGGNLKAATTEKRITKLSGKTRNQHHWMDYSICVELVQDGKTPIEHAQIQIEQRSKNFEKKRRRWREHRCSNVYRGVMARVHHPSLPEIRGLHCEELYPGDYYGKSNRVNHSHIVPVKDLYRGRAFEISLEAPYFLGLNGAISSEEMNTIGSSDISLYNLFEEEYRK